MKRSLRQEGQEGLPLAFSIRENNLAWPREEEKWQNQGADAPKCSSPSVTVDTVARSETRPAPETGETAPSVRSMAKRLLFVKARVIEKITH